MSKKIDPPGAPPAQPVVSRKAASKSDDGSERPRNRFVGRIVVAGLIIALLIAAAVAAAMFRGFPPTAAERVMTAVHAGDTASVEHLLESSPHLLESGDAERLTPLSLAAIRGDTSLVRRLLDRGAETPDQPLTLRVNRREKGEERIGNRVRGDSTESEHIVSGTFH